MKTDEAESIAISENGCSAELADYRISTDPSVNFIVACHGWSGSKWLAAVLNMHSDIFCVHSRGEIEGSMDEYDEYEVRKRNVKIDRLQKSLDSHFEELRRRSRVIAYGSVHTYRTTDIAKLVLNGFKGTVAAINLVRHPVKFVHSGAGQYEKLCTKDPHSRYEVLNTYVNNLTFCESVCEQHSIDPCDWGFLSFVSASTHLYSLYEEAMVIQGMPCVRMERLTSDPAYFREILVTLTNGMVNIDDGYLNDVFSSPRINRHKSANSELSAREQFHAWPEWKRQVFKFYFEESKIGNIYQKLDYDLSFI